MPIVLQPNARAIAAHVVERVWKESAFAAAVLDAAVDRYPELDPRERALATELAYGSLRTTPHIESRLSKHARQGLADLDSSVRAHLVVAGYQLLFLERVPAFAAVSEAVEQISALRGKRMGAFANAVLRRLSEEPAPDKRAALERATRESVAPALLEALVRTLGDEGAVSFLSGGAMPPVVLRVRVGEDRARWIERLQELLPRAVFEPGIASPWAVLMRGGGDPQKLAAFRAGEIAIHEEGAQVIALATGAQPGETVLDACAGRGNKTALLAEMVGPNGAVDAVDQHPSKLARLTTELGRLHLNARATFAVDWSVGAGAVPDAYDRVLVDAPCSGTGTLRRRPDLAARWNMAKVADLARLQTEILVAAATRVKVGGLVVYAVCSVLREESEDVVEEALRRAPWLEMAELSSTFAPVLAGKTAVRLMPQEHGTDGYFLAALRRRA